MTNPWPNHALQRTAAGHRGCHRRASWPPSLSLGGDDYSEEDAVVIATNEPGAAREFVTPFALNQPGARVALKVYVVLNTGNEAGSAALFVQRPVSVPLAA